MSKEELEEGLEFTPRYDDKGLIPCITTSADSNKVLMFAYMNEEAIRKTLETGEAHYWSRSRNALWHKGASSGLVQKIKDIRIDCDQDCVLISVEMDMEASCHTGRHNCFYRRIEDMDTLSLVDDKRLFDPDDVY